MEFRLTYEGELLASNVGRDEKAARKAYKRKVRRVFHGQLKRLWEIMPFLKTGYGSGPEIGGYAKMERPFHDKEAIARKFSLYGFNFLPLVTADLGLLCWLDILFLRRQPPGDLWKHGDIDNRLKTLFDCLTIPDAHQEYETISPGPDETPFYCLLEDDRLISKITVETDQLLQNLPGKQPDQNDARLVITVRLRPYELHWGNMQFG